MAKKYAQVLFFPIKWFPPFILIERLKDTQTEIRGSLQNINKHAQTQFHAQSRKQKLHNELRSHIKLVK